MEKGKLIGRGRTAEVYEWGKDKVIKLYYDWYQEEWIKRDLETELSIFKARVPCPEVFERVDTEDRHGIVYERLVGKTMLTAASEKPKKMLSCGKNMALLHLKIHNHQTEGLMSLKEKLTYNITHAEQLSSLKKEKILQYLNNLPEGKSICHGDFHPDNIMETSKGNLVIDWSTAATGNPLSDVARTCLILKSPYLPPGMPKIMVALIQTMRKQMLSSYLKHYTKLTHTKKKDIDTWLLPHAAARLREGVPGEEKWLLKLIDQRIGG